MHKKGLKGIAESTPNFSNQGLENAINDIKNVDEDGGHSWIKSSIAVDTAINDNTVLTDSQKNDLIDTINNQPYLNVGKYFGDLVRHTASIINGSIIPTTDANPEPTTFLDILQEVQSVQNLVPSLFGCTPGEKNRDVNDHFGTLNNMFLETEDSSKPVLVSLKETFEFLQMSAKANNTLAVASAAVRYSNTQLIDFLNSIVDDSSDFQTTLNNRASTLAGNVTNLHNQLANEPYLTKRNQLIADRDAIVTQINLENSNITGIEEYTNTLSNNLSYSTVAEDSELRKLMANVAQDANWKTYFNDYEKTKASLNPIYNIIDDSDKSFVINDVLASRGLPDVTDYLDLSRVVEKAKRDSRIDTKDFNQYAIDTIIEDCCKQLGLYTFGDVYNQSQRLLNNLNQRDRDLVDEELDLNEDADTLS